MQKKTYFFFFSFGCPNLRGGGWGSTTWLGQKTKFFDRFNLRAPLIIKGKFQSNIEFVSIKNLPRKPEKFPPTQWHSNCRNSAFEGSWPSGTLAMEGRSSQGTDMQTLNGALKISKSTYYISSTKLTLASELDSTLLVLGAGPLHFWPSAGTF